ncbi:MAG: tRNA pseudouridine(38-40) synthase TruA [Verrucomicrobia bacterium]|nr:tRNA pseudouridine(38-40) synthase TruA [Verrucomicrobiota bacterium]
MDTLKYKLTIAYDGTAYQGWQIQKIGTGVQEKVEEGLARLFPSKPRLHSSSRTDTGVHALGMVAHFEVPRAEGSMSAQKLSLALNAWIPPDIRIMAATRAHASFHARFDAVGKQYRYFVWNHRAMNPLLRHSAWHVPRKLNLASMRQAAVHLPGKHDFQCFSANPGYTKATTVRTLTRCKIQAAGPLLTFIIEGDGFLYRMCRGIVGTLVQVGQGKFQPDDVRGMLESKIRSSAGMSAPAAGLALWKVRYPKKGASNLNPGADSAIQC